MKMMKQYEAKKVLLPLLVECPFHAVVVALGLGCGSNMPEEMMRFISEEAGPDPRKSERQITVI